MNPLQNSRFVLLTAILAANPSSLVAVSSRYASSRFRVFAKNISQNNQKRILQWVLFKNYCLFNFCATMGVEIGKIK